MIIIRIIIIIIIIIMSSLVLCTRYVVLLKGRRQIEHNLVLLALSVRSLASLPLSQTNE